MNESPEYFLGKVAAHAYADEMRTLMAGWENLEKTGGFGDTMTRIIRPDIAAAQLKGQYQQAGNLEQAPWAIKHPWGSSMIPVGYPIQQVAISKAKKQLQGGTPTPGI
jgi:hypothetical protein